MATNEIFESCVRTAGDLAGAFEYDGDVGYFYLYETVATEGQKVLASIHVLSGDPAFTEADISVRWDSLQHRVGLFLKGVLWAAFDGRTRAKYGGNYMPNAGSTIPLDVAAGFGGHL